eukprot:gene19797-23683_t
MAGGSAVLQGGHGLPEKVIQSRYAPRWAGLKDLRRCEEGCRWGPARGDCVEAALRDVVNMLLFEPERQCFDLSVLPTHLAVSPRLAQFYCRHGSAPHRTNSEGQGQDWMELCADLPRLKYRQPERYELRSSALNALEFLCQMFGADVATFAELGDALSSRTRLVRMEEVQLGSPHRTKVALRVRFHQAAAHAEIGEVHQGDAVQEEAEKCLVDFWRQWLRLTPAMLRAHSCLGMKANPAAPVVLGLLPCLVPAPASTLFKKVLAPDASFGDSAKAHVPSSSLEQWLVLGLARGGQRGALDAALHAVAMSARASDREEGSQLAELALRLAERLPSYDPHIQSQLAKA